MISVQISEKSKDTLFLELKNKTEGIKEINSSTSKKEIADAVFSMSALDFIKTTNMKARSMKSYLHHVYDWNELGKESGRLFRIIKTNQVPGSMSIYYRFNNSNNKVPVPNQLKNPGKTGKSVKKSFIFKKKAEVMESGKQVSFITNNTIVFLKNKEIKFIPKNKLIRIANPGGKDTENGFLKHFISWWSTKPEQIVEKSGMFPRIEKNVANSLNVKFAGNKEARSAIRKTTLQYATTGSIV